MGQNDFAASPSLAHPTAAFQRSAPVVLCSDEESVVLDELCSSFIASTFQLVAPRAPRRAARAPASRNGRRPRGEARRDEAVRCRRPRLVCVCVCVCVAVLVEFCTRLSACARAGCGVSRLSWSQLPALTNRSPFQHSPLKALHHSLTSRIALHPALIDRIARSFACRPRFGCHSLHSPTHSIAAMINSLDGKL